MQMWMTTLHSIFLAAMVSQSAWQTVASVAVMSLCIGSSDCTFSRACASHDTPQSLLPTCFAAHVHPSSIDSAALISSFSSAALCCKVSCRMACS